MIGANARIAFGKRRRHFGAVIAAGLLAAVMIVLSLPATGQQGVKVLVRLHTQSGEWIPATDPRGPRGRGPRVSPLKTTMAINQTERLSARVPPGAMVEPKPPRSGHDGNLSVRVHCPIFGDERLLADACGSEGASGNDRDGSLENQLYTQLRLPGIPQPASQRPIKVKQQVPVLRLLQILAVKQVECVDSALHVGPLGEMPALRHSEIERRKRIVLAYSIALDNRAIRLENRRLSSVDGSRLRGVRAEAG